MDAAFEAKAFTVLAVLAILLLVIVTGGVIYLTAAEWRDRRRLKREQELSAPRRKK
ncbi:MAG: hypothetical protein F6J95_018820 [Leptolyngbya sp. SIO1E4]|nr:hypothetical protein [Leptolyngbya sp. SIO1E4]